MLASITATAQSKARLMVCCSTPSQIFWMAIRTVQTADSIRAVALRASDATCRRAVTFSNCIKRAPDSGRGRGLSLLLPPVGELGGFEVPAASDERATSSSVPFPSVTVRKSPASELPIWQLRDIGRYAPGLVVGEAGVGSGPPRARYNSGFNVRRNVQ